MSQSNKNKNLIMASLGLIGAIVIIFALLLIKNGSRGDKEIRHEQGKSCSNCNSVSHDSCVKNDSTFVVPVVQ